MSTTTSGRRAQAKAAFDEEIARMKRREEAAGQWCTCGHSLQTHDVGFTCQFRDCSCLNFKPSNTPAPATAQTEDSICIVDDCVRLKAGCDYCERHHLKLCGQLHHRLRQSNSAERYSPTPTQGEHTPLPWRGERINGAILLKDAEDHSIAEVWSSFIDSIDDANATFIVKAVNNHAKLVQCLTNLVKMTEDGDLTTVELDEARAALADVQEA